MLDMAQVSARWVLRMLTDDQKRTRLNISTYLLSRYEDGPCDFIEIAATPEETWVHHFESESTMTVATECGFEILPHPPYSPDMTPSDFHLFPKLKSCLRGTQYGSNEGAIEAVNEYLGTRIRPYILKG